MKLTVNGEDATVELGVTVTRLLLALGITGPVAVERNGEVVPRAAHAETVLEAGDAIEIVHFVGGG